MFHYPGKRNGIALPQAMDMIINNSDIIATAKKSIACFKFLFLLLLIFPKANT
jgi:hypothetical protein